MTRDIAIAHDQFRTMGGAERVAVQMARTLDAPIYAGRVKPGVCPDDVEIHEVFSDRIGRRAMRSHYLVQDLYQMLGWQHVEDLYEYDTVIINKTNPGWFVPKDTQTTIWYLHSTPRGLYDQWHRHGRGYLTAAMKAPMRVLYAPNTRYADAWACNSELVQRRMGRYWDIDEEDVNVIYPPVPTDTFGPENGTGGGGHYVTISRLYGHKRVDHIVRAFNQLGDGYQLVVAGDGPEREELEELAGPNVDIRGYVDEEEKARLLADAEAFVFAAENEDFGIAPIEALASGTPVIGVGEGFTQHQIVDGENGLTFALEGGHLRETIRHFDRVGVEWEAERLQAFADQFGTEQFERRLREWVAGAQSDAAVSVEWADPMADEPEPAETVVADGGGGD